MMKENVLYLIQNGQNRKISFLRFFIVSVTFTGVETLKWPVLKFCHRRELFLLIFVSESTVSMANTIIINIVHKYCVSSQKAHALCFV